MCESNRENGQWTHSRAHATTRDQHEDVSRVLLLLLFLLSLLFLFYFFFVLFFLQLNLICISSLILYRSSNTIHTHIYIYFGLYIALPLGEPATSCLSLSRIAARKRTSLRSRHLSVELRGMYYPTVYRRGLAPSRAHSLVIAISCEQLLVALWCLCSSMYISIYSYQPTS